MFQFALYRNLRDRRSDVFLDIHEYEEARERSFDLDKAFAIAYRRFDYPILIWPLVNFDRYMNAKGKRTSGVRGLFGKVSGGLSRRAENLYLSTFEHISDRQFFDPGYLSGIGRAYLEGYWQSPRYFEEGDIRRAFSFSKPADPSVALLLERIQSSHSIAIHFRRGDYAENPALTMIYGNICTPAYYARAADLAMRRVGNPTFFVFSDDIEWVRHQSFVRELGNIVEVEINHRNSWTDMMLMSKCKHNIVANSSYSWWAAWLNDNPSKMVICPSKWVNEGYEDKLSDLSEILPRDWIKIDG